MIALDHFVWFPVEGAGYEEDASAATEKVNPVHFKPWFKEYIPVSLGYQDKEAFMFFNRSKSPFLLMTRLGFTEDELGREAATHHSVVVHKELLKQNKVSLFDIKESLRLFDEENPKPKGDIERLKVPEKEGQGIKYKGDLSTLITPSAVKSLVYRSLKNKNNRTILRCQGSDVSERFSISAYLIDLFVIEFNLRPLSLTTKRPRGKYCNLFDVAVVEKTFSPPRHSDYWSYINWDLEEFNKGTPKNKKLKMVFEKIDNDFHHDISEYLE